MDKLYSTRLAAEYLGISLAAMKQHIIRGNIAPELVGDRRVFRQEQLDEFKNNRRSPGRPRQERMGTQAAAKYLGITVAELRKQIADKAIKPHREGRKYWFTQSQLDSWKEGQS